MTNKEINDKIKELITKKVEHTKQHGFARDEEIEKLDKAIKELQAQCTHKLEEETSLQVCPYCFSEVIE